MTQTQLPPSYLQDLDELIEVIQTIRPEDQEVIRMTFSGEVTK